MPAVGPKLTLTGSMPGSGGTGSAAVDSISHEQEREQGRAANNGSCSGGQHQSAVLCKVPRASKEDELQSTTAQLLFTRLWSHYLRGSTT